MDNAWQQRISILLDAVGPVTVTFRSSHDCVNSLTHVTSSRLGRDPAVHRQVCEFLCRSMRDCRERNGTLLIASGTAMEPWAARAAQLFRIPVLKMVVDAEDETADLVVHIDRQRGVSRDAVAIAMADRVDALMVRRGGTIQHCLHQRVTKREDATTRVVTSLRRNCAAAPLIACGAVGWYRTPKSADTVTHATDRTMGRVDENPEAHADDLWTRTEGQWLIHCTRGPGGPWPEETVRQYRDSLIIGNELASFRDALDALVRIVRSGRLKAAATATRRRFPVVCFSALSLNDLLRRRCFRPQLGRWDYEPYGIAISTKAAIQYGIQPVVYGDPAQRHSLPTEQRFRFHPIGRTFDWRQECEWRSPKTVDLSSFERDQVRVFAADSPEARARLQQCPWLVTFVSPTIDTADVSNRQKPV